MIHKLSKWLGLSGKSKSQGNNKNSLILEAAERSGASYDEMKEIMKYAKQESRISYSSFVKYELWKYPKEEIAALYPVCKAVKSVYDRRLNEAVEVIVAATDISQKEAVKQLQEAFNRDGIDYEEYVKAKLYNYPAEERLEAYRDFEVRYLAKHSGYNAPLREYEHWLGLILEKTGWDREHAESKIKNANNRTLCTAKEFFLMRFDKRKNEEQKTYFVKKASFALKSKYRSDPLCKRIMLNKEYTNRYFSEMVPRPWCNNKKVSKEEFQQLFTGINKVIYKPVDGHKGFGIEMFDIDELGVDTVYEKVSELPSGVVEECLVQHPDMAEMNPSSVNTIRVVTISNKYSRKPDEDEFCDIIYARLRIGGGGAFVDNFSSGGMVAGVDLDTGKVITVGVDMDGHSYEVHPMTKTPIKGFQIPEFDKVIDLVKEGCKKSVASGYIGWDIAISDKGPQLIEANIMPGVCVCQVPLATEDVGLKFMMAKYLEGTAYETITSHERGKRAFKEKNDDAEAK